MVVHALTRLGIYVENLIIGVILSFPGCWDWRLEALNSNIKKLFVFFRIHTQKRCIAMNLSLSRHVIAIFTLINHFLHSIVFVILAV